jgi:hypothetical protein
MPRPHPGEFRCRAVGLANQRDENGERVTPIASWLAIWGFRSRACGTGSLRPRSTPANVRV